MFFEKGDNNHVSKTAYGVTLGYNAKIYYTQNFERVVVCLIEYWSLGLLGMFKKTALYLFFYYE